jgi:hypothetical protein
MNLENNGGIENWMMRLYFDPSQAGTIKRIKNP